MGLFSVGWQCGKGLDSAYGKPLAWMLVLVVRSCLVVKVWQWASFQSAGHLPVVLLGKGWLCSKR